MSDVRIAERGYRPYTGPRRGTSWAVSTTARHTLRELLGLRRRAREKLLPFGLAAASYLPAIGFVTVTMLAPEALRPVAQDVLPGPEAYLGGIILLVYLATALGGPGALCPDRRSGMLALYLASPLSRDTYLAAKAAAVVTFLALVTVVPPLIYVVGSVLAGAGPEGALAVALTVARVVGAGVALAVLFAAVSLAVASLTERRAAAAIGVVLLALLSTTLVPVLVRGYDAPAVLALLDVTEVAQQAVTAVYGQSLPGGRPPLTVAVAWSVWTAGGLVFARWRLHALTVSR